MSCCGRLLIALFASTITLSLHLAGYVLSGNMILDTKEPFGHENYSLFPGIIFHFISKFKINVWLGNFQIELGAGFQQQQPPQCNPTSGV